MSNLSIYLWLVWWAMWLMVGTTARKTVAREPLLPRLAHWLPLALGCVLTLSHLVMRHDRWLIDRAIPTGVVGAIAGLLFASWARGHLGRNWSGLIAIKEGHELVRTGPYKWLRHPIYAGLVFAGVSTAISLNTLPAVGGVLLCIFACIVKLNHEEKFLRAAFGSAYVRLCDGVPDRLIPFVY